MNDTMLLAHHPSGPLDSWTPILIPLGLFGLAVAALFVAGRGAGRGPAGALLRIPRALERLTSIPGWAAVTVGTSLMGLLVAGIGFYSDVAWHVAYGRDEELFTPPHTGIVVGLGLIAAGAALGVLVASMAGERRGFRVGPLRVPYSLVPLGLLGVGALSGFPLDELWHARFGIDVTMWSPTHLLMIVGASLSPLACWLVLAESGAHPGRTRWTTGVHFVTAWLTVMGLSSVQGEFVFGVPQFQLLYLPVLVTGAAAFGLVATRIVLGRGAALAVGVVGFVLGAGGISRMAEQVLDVRRTGFYVGTAVLVELVAWAVDTERPLRFGAWSGLAAGTLGLGAEWWWNLGSHQPWTPALLPDAVIWSVVVGVGAGILGAGFGEAVAGRRTPMRGIPIAVAAVLVLVALAVPMPRRTGDVQASVDVTTVGEGLVHVDVQLDPPDAADDARWFQALAWQGGGLAISELRELAPGRWTTTDPVPADGRWKTLLRLHRGAEMMAVPIWLPADEEIGEPEVPAVDRHAAFRGESRYLLREAREGPAGFAWGITGTVLAFGASWLISLGLVARRLHRRDARAGVVERDATAGVR